MERYMRILEATDYASWNTESLVTLYATLLPFLLHTFMSPERSQKMTSEPYDQHGKTLNNYHGGHKAAGQHLHGGHG